MTDPGQLSGRGSPTARLALTVVIGLLVYASLFPNSGWSDVGVGALEWLSAPLPRYWTLPEVTSNVLVYMPVGALLVWSVSPRRGAGARLLIAVLVAAVLSATMESLQTFLPDRYASNVDFAANVGGALLGALLAVVAAWVVRRLGWHARWGERVLLPRSHPALVLAALWLLVQMPPHAMLFGAGDIASLFPLQMQRIEALLPGVLSPPPIWRVRAEALCTSLAVVGVTMLLAHCLHRSRWRIVLAPALVALALVLKFAAQPLTLTAQLGEFAWLTPGAIRGLLVGALVAMVLDFVPAAWQRRAAMLALGLQLLVVNLFPADRYFLSTLASGYTSLLHLEDLVRELAVVWPFVALGWMVLSAGSRRAAAQQDGPPRAG